MARSETLTGLPNCLALEEYLQQAIACCAPPRRVAGGVIVLKDIVSGRHRPMRAPASRSCCRRTGTLGRWRRSARHSGMSRRGIRTGWRC